MGCAGSKQKRCKHCQAPYSPMMPRSYSMHVHHPPQNKNDTYHLVALTSSTLGSLKLDSVHQINDANGFEDDKKKEFSVGLIEAKTWSNMINDKIPKVVPKTPVRTPPGEPEMINAWELMEGLEDISPFRSPVHVRSFSFDVVRDPNPLPVSDRPKSRFQENDTSANSPKAMWLQTADSSNPPVTEFDPEVISSFRKSLEEQAMDAKTATNDDDLVFADHKCKEKEELILYFTSLRGVRKTYEDCCDVRVILKGLGIRVDERDVSMHSGFKEELKELLKDGFYGGGLPRVFVGNNYIGGTEEIRKLHEDGQLEKMLECCEKVDEGACEACGDVRFVPCETCSGSCKIYYDEEGEEEADEEDYGFQRCPDCNENGLIRCPICCH
ncbi:Uncharacterized protein L484_027161 [Morus notabilis]|uniref:Glutaredoxin domain-containing protein n=1 Tax=Morus notabilis TaxID=981085 RepID=W9S939_9ROSA|nr:uncharacterized protein At3g28850 [Morus notabilis]EXC20606.1 Uncharacterized protein L484_027161 [Morus notabilis]